MKKTTKVIYSLLIILLIALGFWLYLSLAAKKYQQKIDSIMPLVKNQLNFSESDNLKACVYDENKDYIIISLNHQDYFIVKNNQLKIIDLLNTETKERYSNLPIDNDFSDIYWVLEYCK